MGYGDDIMASGFARGMRAQGKRAAFGDKTRIIWGPWSAEIFRHNPNVAKPGCERDRDLQWIDYYKGHRNYNRLDAVKQRWVWNYEFKPKPGELFFDAEEREFAARAGRDFALIEPNVPWHKSVAPNKDWRLKNYQAVADMLLSEGNDVVQTSHGRDRLSGVRVITTPTFRHALAVLSRAKLAIIPEGGLHHGAAALGVRAVVLFGGFIPPAVTGYDGLHINLTGDAEACGSLRPCKHCFDAMSRITIDEVQTSARFLLQ
jgi:Glycosyltransferase family 9 (heptosyltransferase)